MPEWIQTALVILGFIVAGFLAWGSLRRGELKNLAETRGEYIKDLTEKVSRLENEVAEMRGRMDAMQALKAAEIAVEVAELLKPTIDRLGDVIGIAHNLGEKE